MTALRKVLVVDDDPVVRKSFDRVLTGKGYAVITAENGEEALRKLGEEKYDVVYTDIRMPGMSGLDVAAQVNKPNRPWTPVVIITGYGTEEAEARAKAAGVSSFLHKPLSPEMIEGSARTVLTVPETAEAEPLPAIELPAEEEMSTRSALLNVALFFAAPFIGLAYIVAFPFVGGAVLAILAWRAANQYGAFNKGASVAKYTGLIVAAPFLGLAYVTLFPLIGLVMLAWMGGRAMIGAGTRGE